jgi:hypothetical protein
MRVVGKVCKPLQRVKTDQSVVLTVKSGLDSHMSNKLKDEIKAWFGEF